MALRCQRSPPRSALAAKRTQELFRNGNGINIPTMVNIKTMATRQQSAAFPARQFSACAENTMKCQATHSKNALAPMNMHGCRMTAAQPTSPFIFFLQVPSQTRGSTTSRTHPRRSERKSHKRNAKRCENARQLVRPRQAGPMRSARTLNPKAGNIRPTQKKRTGGWRQYPAPVGTADRHRQPPAQRARSRGHGRQATRI